MPRNKTRGTSRNTSFTPRSTYVKHRSTALQSRSFSTTNPKQDKQRQHPSGCFPSCWSVCAYLPTRQFPQFRLRIFTHKAKKRAHIYPQACAYLPTNGHLSTGANLRLNLFPQVAYNYIPVDLYPHGGSTNQQHQELKTERLPPRLRLVGLPPKSIDLVATKHPIGQLVANVQ